MKNTLYMMCGVAGTGKSTFVKNACKEGETIVSRDAIRFSLIKEGEEYFSKENQVFKEFVRQIDEGLKKGNVYADATHLTKASRNKLMRALHEVGYEDTVAIALRDTLSSCLAKNERRKGTEKYVPRSVIRRMSHQFEIPTLDEGFKEVKEIALWEDR